MKSVDIGGRIWHHIVKSERLDIYKKYAEELLENGHAYKCFCTAEELEAEREAQKAKGDSTTLCHGKCRHLTRGEVAAKEAKAVSQAFVCVCLKESNVYI